jgi:hypothetical protein
MMTREEQRDFFAIHIVQAFVSRDLPEGQSWNKEAVAKDAYEFADVMLRVRDE